MSDYAFANPTYDSAHLINAKVQFRNLGKLSEAPRPWQVFGLRGVNRVVRPCVATSRLGAPGYLLSRLWLSERFTVKARLCSKAGAFQKVATPIVNRSESPEGRALKAAHAVLRLLPRAWAIGGEPRLTSAAFRARRGDSGGNQGLLASVMVPRSFPNTAARQFRSLTGFPIPSKCLQNKHYIWYMTKDVNTIYTKCHGNKALFMKAVVNDTGKGFIEGS